MAERRDARLARPFGLPSPRPGAWLLLACGGCLPSLQRNPPREPSRQLPAHFGTARADAGTGTDAGAATGTGASSDAGAAAGTGPDASSDAGAATPAAAGGDADANAAHVEGIAQQTWASFFAGTELPALITAAVGHNQELGLGLQEIVIAQAEVSARRGEIWPKLGIGVGAGIDRVGHSTSQGASDEANRLPQNLGDFGFGLGATWEVDIWRRLRDARDAADVRYLASIEARSFLMTQIVAEVARSYYELLAIDSQLEILRRNIAIQADAVRTVVLEKQAARVTELAVERFEAEVLKNRGRLFELSQERVQTENRLNFLCGRYPQPLALDASEFERAVPAGLQAGLPAALLQNRPDVRQAELVLAGNKLDVKVARAAFYPALSIDAGVGYRAFNVSHLVATPESLVFNLAGRLVAPLLNRSAIAANYEAANARQLQAVLGYERTVLQAFTDVVGQLATLDNLEQVHRLRTEQVATLGRAVDVSMVLFQSARADYMDVLLTRRDYLDAQMELVETKRRRFHAVIGLYQALGGGWRDPARPPG